jgi:hypothetical protein
MQNKTQNENRIANIQMYYRAVIKLILLGLLVTGIMCRDASAQDLNQNKDDARRLERISKSFTVAVTPRVVIETFDGRIAIRGWDKSVVMFTALKRAQDEREMSGISLDAKQNGEQISIAAGFDKSFSREMTVNNQRFLSNSASVEIEIYVPRNIHISASSGDDEILAEGLDGEINLTTKDGSIEFQNGRGRLVVETGDGEINIKNFSGEANARTGDGSINLEGCFTKLEAQTDDGDISLALNTDANANIETDAKLVSNNNRLAVVESSGSVLQTLRLWKVGNGGSLFKLRTPKGAIRLRRISGCAEIPGK